MEKTLRIPYNQKKKIFSAIAIIILLVPIITADIIFSDDFESGTLSGWTLSTPGGGNNWTNVATDPFQGTRHAQSQPQDTDEPASVMERIISTVGYQNININYSRKLVGIDIADEFQMEWNDGNGWVILEQTGSSSPDDANYVYKEFSLPINANNNSDLRIKFECTSGAVSEFCRVDNVAIIGDLLDSEDKTPPPMQFIRGDSNSDGRVDITDSVNIFNYLMTGTGFITCLDAADTNDNGVVDISDGIYLLNFMFLGTTAPPAPFPNLGTDPTQDTLDCQLNQKK